MKRTKGRARDRRCYRAIARIVAQLTAVGKAYIILDDEVDAETYVQTAGTLSEDFIIKRRDGCGGALPGDRRVMVDELVTILVGCLRGATDWSHGNA